MGGRGEEGRGGEGRRDKKAYPSSIHRSILIIHPVSSSLQPLTIRYTTFNISPSAVVSLPIERRIGESPTLFVN